MAKASILWLMGEYIYMMTSCNPIPDLLRATCPDLIKFG